MPNRPITPYGSQVPMPTHSKHQQRLHGDQRWDIGMRASSDNDGEVYRRR